MAVRRAICDIALMLQASFECNRQEVLGTKAARSHWKDLKIFQSMELDSFKNLDSKRETFSFLLLKEERLLGLLELAMNPGRFHRCLNTFFTVILIICL